jgi:hypothetical protein
MKNGIWIDWETIGATLANETGDVQAAFFKAFAREVRRWPTRHQQEAQMFAINRELTDDERDLLTSITHTEPK